MNLNIKKKKQQIITLARLDRLQDALNVAKSLAMQQKAQNKNRYVFKETVCFLFYTYF
jgi:hypothetical protein